MRQRHPFMGKSRLRVMLAREGLELGASTIGRILAKGVRLGRVEPCAFCRGRVRSRRRRDFNGHARRWRYGQHLKEFKAVSPIGKHMVARAHARATAHNAERFLDAVCAEMPHELLSVQVDGGGEFMAEF